MVRAHAYPVLATLSTLSLIGITVLLVPQSVRHHRFNRCVEQQLRMNSTGEAGVPKDVHPFTNAKVVSACSGL